MIALASKWGEATCSCLRAAVFCASIPPPSACACVATILQLSPNMLTICSRLALNNPLADALADGLAAELDLTPKPGLVDCWDSGSHPDLDYRLMRRSVALLRDYFHDCQRALDAGEPIETLRNLGIGAERQMLESFGTNTHRGTIFLGGLLLAGTHAATRTDASTVGAAVSEAAARLFSAQLPAGTVGAQVRTRYQTGGILDEALQGLPAVFQVALPALQEAERLGLNSRSGLYLTMARLMRTVEDTTALRRCGRQGLYILRADGSALESLVLNGEDYASFLIAANERYRGLRLTMGGVADLLGISVGWSLFSRDCPALLAHALASKPPALSLQLSCGPSCGPHGLVSASRRSHGISARSCSGCYYRPVQQQPESDREDPPVDSGMPKSS